MLLLVILLTILYPSVFFVSGRRAPFGISCDASLVVANSLMRMKTFTFFYFKVFDTSMCSRLICKGILFSLTCISGASGISAGDVTSEMENALYSLSKQASSLQPGHLSLRASLPWIGVGGYGSSACFQFHFSIARNRVSELTKLPLPGCAAMGGGGLDRGSRFVHMWFCSPQ